jgi:hypothetical protein
MVERSACTQKEITSNWIIRLQGANTKDWSPYELRRIRAVDLVFAEQDVTLYKAKKK